MADRFYEALGRNALSMAFPIRATISIVDPDSDVPAKSGGLNRSVQHYLEVYLPEFESPKFVAGVD